MSKNKKEVPAGEIRVGIDIGGTFTDFVLFDESKQELVLHKSLTTPVDPSYGAMMGIEELLIKAKMNLSEVTQVVHGTTLATNAIIDIRVHEIAVDQVGDLAVDDLLPF
ncbi:MAG: hypothetical protein GWP36_01645 [Bacteroidetes bacterium]|nr:hypothetical protein [Bacteroidota bacterium]